MNSNYLYIGSVHTLDPQGALESYRTLEGGRPAEQAASGACWGWHWHLLQKVKDKSRKKAKKHKRWQVNDKGLDTFLKNLHENEYMGY